MDYLFKLHVDNPDSVDICCYYVVDDKLKYVGAVELDDSYSLISINSDELEDIVFSSDKIGKLDYYVYDVSRPVLSQTTEHRTVGGYNVRVVTVKTTGENMLSIKKRKPEERNIIERHITGQHKLF